MDDLKFLILYGVLAGVLFASYRKTFRDPKLDNIPVVGSSGFLASYWDAFKFIRHSPDLIQRGYDLYPDGIFRVARLFRWDYVVCGPRLTKDIASAPEHIISFNEGVEEQNSPWVVTSAVRTTLTRNLHACFPVVRDEIVCAFNDVLQLQGSEWKGLPVLPTMMAIVARASNRLFRGEDFFTSTILTTASNFPLGPYETLISELQAPRPLDLHKEQEQCKSPAVFRSSGKRTRATLPITVRILQMNMAAIHTTSTAFTYALFDLTTYPEYLLLMREEAERVVKEEGWTKAALNSMVKIDSFLRESQRINTDGPVGMRRRVVAKDGFRFSDGTVLPYGAYLSVALQPTHYDESNYEKAATFDGFRFARERAEHLANHNHNDNQDIFKRHMISTAVDHLPFGTGKHACPGRFFAATELKAMMAHMVINYDVEAEVEGVRPADKVFDTRISPNAAGKVKFEPKLTTVGSHSEFRFPDALGLRKNAGFDGNSVV
ncbi:cytochrome P450 [Mycena olivaceomarginata]|nr:cytochrome P450 [Mycena olivaceomarginata]